MTYKEVLQKDMQNIKKKTNYRYRAAKKLFIVGAFCFFINFFFVGANFYTHFFNTTLASTYFFFCLSFVGLVYFAAREKLLQKYNYTYSIILILLLVVSFIILLLPVFFSGGIFYFIKL